MAQKHHLIRWIPAISWGLIILVLSLMPGGTGGFTFLGIPHFDKIGHFGMYAGWTFLISLALQGYPELPGWKAFWMSMMIGALIGVVLEFGQYLMDRGRSFEVADMLANAVGAMAGTIAARFFLKIKT